MRSLDVKYENTKQANIDKQTDYSYFSFSEYYYTSQNYLDLQILLL